MGELELPGGMRLMKPHPVAEQIVQGLGPILQSISNQLDVLIRLELGEVDEEMLRGKIRAFDADVKAKMEAAELDRLEQDLGHSMEDAIAEIPSE